MPHRSVNTSIIILVLGPLTSWLYLSGKLRIPFFKKQELFEQVNSRKFSLWYIYIYIYISVKAGVHWFVQFLDQNSKRCIISTEVFRYMLANSCNGCRSAPDPHPFGGLSANCGYPHIGVSAMQISTKWMADLSALRISAFFVPLFDHNFLLPNYITGTIFENLTT